jgi:hypothetical protein
MVSYVAAVVIVGEVGGHRSNPIARRWAAGLMV